MKITIVCGKCRSEERSQKLFEKFNRDICSECFLKLIGGLPNPDCEYCSGNGEYCWHSADCDNNDCILASGYPNCNGRMIECDCSILDFTGEICNAN